MSNIREQFLKLFEASWNGKLGWENARFVVVDSETTGFDPKKDRLVSIGAVGVDHFQINLEDAFEAVLPIAYNTSAVTVHGITREAANEFGVSEPVAVGQFLEYLKDGIIVGHHIEHDIQAFETACQRHFGFDRLPNLFVDTMDLTLRLEALGFIERDVKEGAEPDFSLDGLCRRFEIKAHDRHTATGDAFLTAQVFLKLLKKAKRAGFLKLSDLTARYEP